MSERQPREQWSSQCDFLLCLIGYSVGVGNMWRFPYLCYKYGGGTFLIPYLVMLVLIGIPVYTMELALGQYARLSPNVLFGQLAPLFSGVGYGMIIINGLVCFYYNMVITWMIFFAGASFRNELEWSRCGHSYNSPDCFTIAQDKQCQNESSGTELFWNNTCYPISDFSEQRNFTSAVNSSCNSDRGGTFEHNRILSSEEYFNNYVLGMKNFYLNGLSRIRWEVSLCLLLAWLMVGGCIFQGIKAFGKILNFTVIFPYFIMFLLLLLSSARLTGATKGIMYYLKPELSKLKDLSIWSSAAAQIFYSLGCGQGTLTTMASFNRRNNNCMRDAILVAVINSLTSVISAFIVFMMLGFIAHELCTDIRLVVTSDLGLAFITYPEVMVHMPASTVFSALFFIMMTTLGIDTQFIAVESLVIAAVDQWPALRPRKSLVVVGLCVLFFVSNLSMCMDGGVMVFALVDHYAFSFSLFAILLLQAVAVGWVYDAERLLKHMQHDMRIEMPPALYRYWQLSWRVSVPAVTLLGLFTTLYHHQPASYRGARFPLWADAVGLCVMVGPTLLVAAVALAEAGLRQGVPHRWKELISPTADWGGDGGGGGGTVETNDTPQSGDFPMGSSNGRQHSAEFERVVMDLLSFRSGAGEQYGRTRSESETFRGVSGEQNGRTRSESENGGDLKTSRTPETSASRTARDESGGVENPAFEQGE